MAATTREGRIHRKSKGERAVFKILSNRFNDVIPSKQIDIYNADFAVGSVTVEVFSGGWSVSDRKRIDRYIDRCKKISSLGFHTVFVILYDSVVHDASELIRTIEEFSSLPPGLSQYRVIWGNRKGASGNGADIDHDAFISPFVNVRDPATGVYVSVPRDTVRVERGTRAFVQAVFSSVE
jgi:hypothetical protein